ncbi:uncharacterized protein DUF5134 [Streptomyces sp. 840.1]|uniref:DUF5134 domain-containing protein n=1 Tax=Streptomyces sp. 840.1 TaxID=2485152 RepID=UPI000F46E8ED|nr:DUF5134 domain-containing protein [Streptomyces sp. 840.1]ROQ60138.1 uncharacterized protein DUF5134 [Streptomyces sp. 840.1]
MSAVDTVHCLMTVLFTAAAIHLVRWFVVSRDAGWRERVDHLLHAVMALAMAVMPWHWGEWLSHPAPIVFFLTAALWFPLTAVRRRRVSLMRAVAGRLPSAAGMSAMAWMTWMAWQGHAAARASHEIVAGGPTLAHPVGDHRHVAPVSDPAQAVTATLALILLASALAWLIRIMPDLRADVALPQACDDDDLYRRFWHGAMALGTAIMLFMPH